MTERTLSAVPDPEPEEEVTTGVPDEAPPVAGYTVRDQVHANASLVTEVIEAHGLEHLAAVQLVGITFNYHLTKIQLGLSAPVEG